MSSQICPVCQSANRREFPAEINIHFPRMEGLTKPTVWAFPCLTICLDCGVVQFSLADAELDRLAERGSSQSYRATVYLTVWCAGCESGGNNVYEVIGGL